VSSRIDGLCKKIVLDPILHSQHRSIGIQVNAAITPNIVPFKRRFNYRKAKWDEFTNELDQKIQKIAPKAESYNTFAELVKKTARRHIPRGCSVKYIPGLSNETAKEYDEYVSIFEMGPFSEETSAKGESVMDHISQERRKTWHTLIESIDMSKNSKKAWSTIGKLRGDPKRARLQPKVTANQVAHQLLLNGKSETLSRRKTKLERKKYTKDPGYTNPFTLEELEAGTYPCA
jgi:hypothetical protein